MTAKDDQTTNAVHYAVLRRLAPGFRHGLLAEQQAIEALAELASRQMQANADAAQACDGMSRIITHTRKALGSCSAMVEWLRPEAGAICALGAGIAQCLKVAGDDWQLRGIEATTELQAADALVDRAALREVFTASIIALIDMHPGALDIDVQSAAESEHIDVSLRARSAERRSNLSPSDQEPKFTWADVQALANAHGVRCTCHANGATIRLRRIATQAA